jgi:hypothetical protein
LRTDPFDGIGYDANGGPHAVMARRRAESGTARLFLVDVEAM